MSLSFFFFFCNLIALTVGSRRLLLSSGYGDQLGFIELDTSSGKALFIGQQSVDANLTYIRQYDGENFFAGHQVLTPIEGLDGEGGISRWTLDRHSLKMERQQLVTAGGYDPAFLSFNRQRSMLFVANYWGPTFVAIDYDVGSLEMESEPFFIESWEDEPGSGVYPGFQQNSSHPHCALAFYDGSIFVSDLGRDKIVVFEVNDDNSISYVDEYDTPPGMGPRHLTFDFFENNLLVVGELSPTVVVYKILSEHRLEEVQVLHYHVDPPKELSKDGQPLQFGAEIASYVTLENQEYVYVSQRDYGAIMVFEYNSEEGLTLLDQTNLVGQWPRDFTIITDREDPALLVTVSEFEDLMEVFRINEQTGLLTKTHQLNIQQTPTCVLEAQT